MAKLTKSAIDSITPGDKDIFAWDDELKGFGIRVKPSGVKSWVLHYRNKQRQSKRITLGQSTKMTPAQARKDAKIKFGEIADGKDPAAEKKKERNAVTFKEFTKTYLDDHATPHKKPRSVAEDRRNLDKHILPTLGRMQLATINKSDIARLHAKMSNVPIAANRTLALLSSIFMRAEDWGDRPVYSNPCHGVKKYPENKRERYLSPAEYASLGAALNKIEKTKMAQPMPITAIRLILFTGARKGEILNLKWRDVDFERAALRIPDYKESKSSSGFKTIPLPAPALQILSNMILGKEDDYIFPGRKDGPISSLQHTWKTIRAEAGLDDVRIHDLRHSFASAAVSMEMSLPMIGKILGHKRASTTERYAHLDNDAVAMAASRVGDAIAAMVDGKAGKVVKLRR